MIETIRNAWKIPELRKKILFTVFALLIFRLGSVVPVPFIDSNMLGATLNNMGGIFTLLGAMALCITAARRYTQCRWRPAWNCPPARCAPSRAESDW